MNKQIDEILHSCNTVAIIGHINPDGDCFGSISGVYDYISTKFNCKADCFADCNVVAEEFKPFVKDINFNPIPLDNYDICICVDTADIKLFGKYINVFYSSKVTVCIDHHSTNKGFADINIINPLSSNCENIYNLLTENEFNISKSTAGKLFAGIITDTNNLTTNSVTKHTYSVVADLLDKGVNGYKIKQFFIKGNSLVQYKLLSIAMNSVKFYNNNTIMLMQITKEQLDSVGGKQEDLTSIINQAFCMKNAQSAILIAPRQGQIHVSFRGKDLIDVSSLAQHFGGGGHKLASAFTIDKLTDNDLNFIINNLSNQINSLPKNNENLF